MPLFLKRGLRYGLRRAAENGQRYAASRSGPEMYGFGRTWNKLDRPHKALRLFANDEIMSRIMRVRQR
jgi:hypothetical protein